MFPRASNYFPQSQHRSEIRPLCFSSRNGTTSLLFHPLESAIPLLLPIFPATSLKEENREVTEPPLHFGQGRRGGRRSYQTYLILGMTSKQQRIHHRQLVHKPMPLKLLPNFGSDSRNRYIERIYRLNLRCLPSPSPKGTSQSINLNQLIQKYAPFLNSVGP